MPPSGAAEENERALSERGSRDALALAELATRHPDDTIAVGSHGNLIALALQLDDPAVGFEFWREMPMPAAYSISR